MFDRYFDQANKIILPLKHSTSSILKKSTSKHTENNRSTSNEDLSDLNTPHNSMNHNIFISHQLLKDKKDNMFLRQDVLEQGRLITKLQSENSTLTFLTTKQKNQISKDAEYIIKLEHIIMTSKEKYEQTKRCLNSQHQYALMTELKAENEKLSKFQQEIYEISKTYDSINSAIFDLIDEIRGLFEELNDQCFQDNSKSNRFGIDYQKEKECFTHTKESIEQMFALMLKAFNSKQDEYKYLLTEKELKLIEMNELNKDLKKQRDELLKDKMNKEFLIDNLKNEVYLMKDRKENPKKYIRNKRSKSQYSLFTEGNKSSLLQTSLLRAKYSLDRSVDKFERVLDSNDEDNKKMIENVKNSRNLLM